MRFVVPVRTVHAGPNPKYFGVGRGVTWYNLISDQFSGLNDITVPGTLRDSLILLAVVLEQQTDLQPTQIMTDTGAYSDVVFGLFRLLGYRFCPRLADVGGTRFWRIDPQADYGLLNTISAHNLSLQKIAPHWDDMLRLAGSLKLGKVPAAGIMRTLQVGDRPTRLAQAIAEFGRIDKTLHTLTYIDDEAKRRGTLTQLNRGEGRHSVARAVFHGKRGELRQHYREGQEDQLGALGLVLNMIVLWNTIYIEEAYYVEKLEPLPGAPSLGDVQGLIGRSPAFVKMMELVARVAPSDASVLLQGESGTGKELVANAIHQLSRRAKQPFVAVDCSGLPETLFESALFGHERGPSPARRHERPGWSRRRRAARCFSTNWATSRFRSRSSCCGCWKPAPIAGWVPRNCARPKSGLSPPPIAHWPTWWTKVFSGRTVLPAEYLPDSSATVAAAR
jgi:TnpA family transposase